MLYSINQITLLPTVLSVKKNSQALALLDACLMPDWEYRYFSFNNKWDIVKSASMASMRNGEGAEYFIYFNDEGACGKIFSGDILTGIDSILMNIPDTFLDFKTEKAFSIYNTSSFFWRDFRSNKWEGISVNQSFDYLSFIIGGADFYHLWAEDYYERSIDKKTIVRIFDTLEVSPLDLEILGRKVDKDILNDILDIVG